MSSAMLAGYKYLNSCGEVFQAIGDASLHAYITHCMASAGWVSGMLSQKAMTMPWSGFRCSRACKRV